MKLFKSFIVLLSVFNEHIICSDANIAIDSRYEVNGPLVRLLRNVPNPREIDTPIHIPDPYELNLAEFSYFGEIFSFNVNISNGSLFGLSDFEVLHLNVSSAQPALEFNILFPHLKFHAEHYGLDGDIYHAVPLKGDGVADIEIVSLQIWGTLHLKNSSNNDGLLLDKLENTALKVDRIMSKTDFDHNIDAIINALVEDLLANYLNRLNKFIIATYSDSIIQYINDLLQQLE